MQEQGRSKAGAGGAGGGTDLPQDTSPRHYNGSLPACLPSFMILYDTLGIYDEKSGGTPHPELRPSMQLDFVLLAWQ